MGLHLAGWLPLRQVAELSILLVATTVVSSATPRFSLTERVVMAPSFVIDFATLLLFGPHVTMLVALAGALSQELAGDEQPPMPRRLFYNLAAILTATSRRTRLPDAGWHRKGRLALAGRCMSSRRSPRMPR